MLPPREYTDNLHLDLYMPCDRPNLRDQYNTAMQKLDRAFKDLDDRDRMFASDVQTLDTAARQAREKALENGHAIDSIEARLDLVDDELKGKAPIFHASPHRDFGLGNETHFGHVKLSDNYLGNETIADGVGSTPKAVHDAFNQLTSQHNNLRVDYNSTVTGINAPAQQILTYKPKNGTWYNTLNLGALYRHGVVEIYLTGAPLPKKEMRGDDVVSPNSAVIGYLPTRYCPTRNLTATMTAFSVKNKMYEQDSQSGTGFVTVKIYPDGRLVMNCDNVEFTNEGNPDDTPGSVDGVLTYIVENIEIVEVR